LLFIVLIAWGIADDFCLPAPTMPGSASEDDEYLSLGCTRPQKDQSASAAPPPLGEGSRFARTQSPHVLISDAAVPGILTGTDRLYALRSLQR
jgi:hypothetical protein